jgi:hypothetical protein
MLWPRCELRPADVVRVRFRKKEHRERNVVEIEG